MGLLRREADAVKKDVARAHGVDPSEVRLIGAIGNRQGYRQDDIFIDRKGKEAVGSASTDTTGVRWGTIGGGPDRSGHV